MRAFATLVLFASSSAAAATITVTDVTGDGATTCSLTEALAAADANAAVAGCAAGDATGTDTVAIDAALEGARFDIAGVLISSGDVVVDGSAAQGVALAMLDGTFTSAASTFTLRNFIVTGSGGNGPIFRGDGGDLVFERVTF